MHYYPFNIADFGLHTAHLTLEEEAVYRRLIDFYYDTEKPIPIETQPVIRRLRLGSYVNEFNQVLNEFFTLEDDGWHSYRCDFEIKAYHDKGDVARANGKKGGRPRKNKGLETQPVILANPDLTQTKANQELRTKNQEPLTNNKILDQSAIDPTVEAHFMDCFDGFWKSGIRKVNKKKAQHLFNSLLKKMPQDDWVSFSIFLVSDVRKRLESNQLGFAEMHPTTYLNGERWNDEVIPNAENRLNGTSGGGRLSAVERVRAANNANRAARANNRDGMADPSGCIRQHDSDPIRGGDAGSMDSAIEGTYTITD